MLCLDGTLYCSVSVFSVVIGSDVLSSERIANLFGDIVMFLVEVLFRIRQDLRGIIHSELLFCDIVRDVVDIDEDEIMSLRYFGKGDISSFSKQDIRCCLILLWSYII